MYSVIENPACCDPFAEPRNDHKHWPVCRVYGPRCSQYQPVRCWLVVVKVKDGVSFTFHVAVVMIGFCEKLVASFHHVTRNVSSFVVKVDQNLLKSHTELEHDEKYSDFVLFWFCKIWEVNVSWNLNVTSCSGRYFGKSGRRGKSMLR